MRSVVRCLWLVLLVSWTVWAKPVKSGHVSVELVAGQNSVVAGQTLDLALHFKLDPKWHLYWKNPGESGLPPEVKWQLPAGWKAPEIQWPVPLRMELSGMTQFVYDDEVVFVFPIQVPADFKADKPVKLSAEVQWLACAEMCVPGNAQVALELPVGASNEPSAQAQLVQSGRQHLPQSPGNIELRSWRLSPEKVFLEYPGKAGDKLDFLPATAEQVVKPDPVSQPGKGVEIAWPAAENSLKGLLLIQNGGERQGVELDLKIADTAPSGSAAAPPATAAGPSMTIFGALFAAFVGGMILNLMPCVFPVLSLKALSLVQHNQDGPGKPAWDQGLVYTLGVLVSVWCLAAPILLLKGAGQQVGWGYQMQSPLFVTLLAALFLGIALNLFGLFEVGEGLTQLAQVTEGKKGLSEAFWSGAVATVAATPCTAPFMASALGYAVAQPAYLAFAIFSVLGFGMAFPYLLLCGIPATRNWLPRPGAWMETFKQALGFPMLATVIWFLYVLANLLNSEGLALIMACLLGLSLAAWAYGRWGYSPHGNVRRRAKFATLVLCSLSLSGAAQIAYHPNFQGGGSSATSSHDGLDWVAYSPEKLSELRAQNKSVFVDFTAAWCINCKVNEAGTLRNQQVVEAFRNRGIVLMKADWTRKDPVIGKALAELGRTGVPVYAFYPKGGEPLVLPELLTPSDVLSALSKG